MGVEFKVDWAGGQRWKLMMDGEAAASEHS